MKARYLLTAIGLSLGIGAPSLIEAQNANQSTGQPTAKRDAKSAATTRQASPGLRRSGLPPSFFDQSEQVRRASLPYGFLDQNDGGGIRFTSSTMRSVTRAG